MIIKHDPALVAKFKPARAAVRPRACLAVRLNDYTGPCWVNDGAPSCSSSNSQCIGCKKTAELLGNSAIHARILIELSGIARALPRQHSQQTTAERHCA